LGAAACSRGKFDTTGDSDLLAEIDPMRSITGVPVPLDLPSTEGTVLIPGVDVLDPVLLSAATEGDALLYQV
jgi:hypothetical protein